jgi:hypothetical protein
VPLNEVKSMRQILTLAVAAVVLVAPAAGAKDFQEVSGTYSVVFPGPPATYDERSPNQCIITVRYLLELTPDTEDDLEAQIDVWARVNNKGPCTALNVPATVHGKGEALQASLGDESGAFSANVVFKHEASTEFFGGAHGQATIQQASGDLAGLHGILNLEGTVILGGRYSGRLHFSR